MTLGEFLALGYILLLALILWPPFPPDWPRFG